MSDGGRSGVGLWVAGLLGFLAYRRGRRRGASAVSSGGRRATRSPGRRGGGWGGGWGGGPDGGPALRRVRSPDGREALQVSAELFVRDEGDAGWRRVRVEGASRVQEALESTLAEVAPGERSAQDVPVLLMPLGTRRGVNAVDVYATGGRVGHLPEDAVRAVGDAIRATHRANGRPCAVLARIAPDASGALGVEVLIPDTFVPGGSSG